MAHPETPDNVQRALSLAAAANAVAGHEASEFARDTTRRRLMGELSSDEAVRAIVKNAIDAERPA